MMKKITKITSVLLAIGMGLMALVGCDFFGGDPIKQQKIINISLIGGNETPKESWRKMQEEIDG